MPDASLFEDSLDAGDLLPKSLKSVTALANETTVPPQPRLDDSLGCEDEETQLQVPALMMGEPLNAKAIEAIDCQPSLNDSLCCEEEETQLQVDNMAETNRGNQCQRHCRAEWLLGQKTPLT